MHVSILSLIYLFNHISTTYATPSPASSDATSKILPPTPNLDLISDFNLNTSPLFNASEFKFACNVDSPQSTATSKANYLLAVQQILIKPDVLVPRRWDLTGGKGFSVRGGALKDEQSCSIIFFSREPLVTIAFPLIWIAHFAALVANQCITEAKEFAGGQANLGPGLGQLIVLHYPTTLGLNTVLETLEAGGGAEMTEE